MAAIADGRPEVVVELEATVPAELPAQSCLRALRPGASFHELLDRRHPLGIYSVSVGRIANKIAKCAAALERCWQQTNSLKQVSKNLELFDAVIDYLELSLYAAAEHVDDVETIAESFFRTKSEASRSPEVRALTRSIKPLRDRIASLANVMKHDHGRLRMYAMEFRHDGHTICLFGFFIEGFKGGAIGPHPIHYGNGESIISIPAFLWSILIFVGRISTELESFVASIGAVSPERLPAEGSHPLRKAVISCARLPLYSLDDVHPFTQTRLVIHTGPAAIAELSSGIYGSFSDRWSDSKQHQFGGSTQLYAGDGVSRSFSLADPKHVRLTYWT